MIAHMAANTVKVRAASSTGDPSDLSIAANRVLGRDGSGNLSSTQVKEDMIGTGAVTNAKIGSSAVTSAKVDNTIPLTANTYGDATHDSRGGKKITISTSGPSGGADGDIWLEYTP